MGETDSEEVPALKSYPAWDAAVRAFHWINLLCVLGLIAVGVAILNDGALGVDNDGKILLKTVHVLIGYVFVLNLAWRLVWAFVGGTHARWRGILPGGRGYLRELRGYLLDLRAGRTRQYVGHDPLGRLAVTMLLILMFMQAVSGLLLAGTDLFYPPIGSWIAGNVAAPGVDPATLVPYAPDMYDAAAYAEMRSWRAPVVAMHGYVFYAILVVAVIHLFGVVATEVRTGSNLISAMVTGKKVLKAPPADQAPRN